MRSGSRSRREGDANREGLRHHYRKNDHHPEHFDEGIRSMSLVQMIEMLCDWKAATLRHADGELLAELEDEERYGN